MKFERESFTLRSQMAVLCMVFVVLGDTLAYAPQSSVSPGRPGGVGGAGGVGGNRPSTVSAGGQNALGNRTHNPQDRGGTPYPNRATADRFGGASRGDSLARSQGSARQQITRQGGNLSPSRPEVREPSLAQRARTLASLGHIGSLSTHSREVAGFPFGSMMPYAVDERGRPVFLISSMAMHTQNLLQDPRASLLITQPDVSGEPLDAPRVTLIGTAAEVPAAEVRELYLSRYENAKLWQDFTDFAYYRLEVTGVYFVGGFGIVGWIAAKDYESARPDPLVDTAAKIIQHMNADHAAGLRLMPRHHSGEAADEAATALDRRGF